MTPEEYAVKWFAHRKPSPDVRRRLAELFDHAKSEGQAEGRKFERERRAAEIAHRIRLAVEVLTRARGTLDSVMHMADMSAAMKWSMIHIQHGEIVEALREIEKEQTGEKEKP